MLQIAVCDDEESAVQAHREMAERCLQQCGAAGKITVYTSSSSLLCDITEDQFYYDLILLDIEMPERTGMELAEKIKPFLPNVKIIFITSHIEYAIDAFELSIFRYVPKNGVQWEPCELLGTIVHVTVEGQYAGHILISDLPKPEAKTLVEGLKAAGVKRAVMLTGDAEAAAKAVAQELGIDEYHAQLLPADKVERVESLLAKKSPGAALAFVGDGINDAPVLTRADIGIAMGALGSDAAIEAADIVLMDDNPAKIATAMRISRKTLRIVKQNIWFALGVKGAVLLLGAFGVATMWEAVFADVGVAFIAILNAMRCLHVEAFKK